MVRRVILLSGPVASGKTTLAEMFVERYDHHLFKTRELIRSLTGTEPAREQLQDAGARLDRRTRGGWVALALERVVAGLKDDATIIVDSVRIKSQIEAIRDAFGPRVIHIHLTAPRAILAQRYLRRSGPVKELASYAAVRRNETENRIAELEDKADVVIDTQRNNKEDVFVRVAAHLGLYGRGVERLVDVLVGGCVRKRRKGPRRVVSGAGIRLAASSGWPKRGAQGL